MEGSNGVGCEQMLSLFSELEEKGKLAVKKGGSLLLT